MWHAHSELALIGTIVYNKYTQYPNGALRNLSTYRHTQATNPLVEFSILIVSPSVSFENSLQIELAVRILIKTHFKTTFFICCFWFFSFFPFHFNPVWHLYSCVLLACCRYQSKFDANATKFAKLQIWTIIAAVCWCFCMLHNLFGARVRK